MNEQKSSMETQSKKLVVEDILKAGWYTLYVSVLAELMLLSQLGNLTYMSYAGYAPKPISCNEIDINETLSTKEACNELDKLEIGHPCKPTLKAQFYSINTEFGYYCENSTIIKNSISYQTIGIIIGSIVFGQLSDLFGRKPILIACLVGTSAMDFIVSLSNSLLMFTLLRGVALFFTGGQIAVMLVYLVEVLPMKDRMWINAIVAWSPNYVIFAGIAYLSYTWRILSQVTSACLIPAIFISFFIEESPRWLIQKKKYTAAEASLKSIIRFEGCKTKCAETVKAIVTNEAKKFEERNISKKRYYVWHLFTSKFLALRTFVLSISYLTTSVLNYGILFDMSQVGGSIYINNCIIGVARWIVNITFGYMDYRIRWFGRRIIYNISMIGMVIVLSTISLLNILYLVENGSGILRYLSLSISIIASHLFIVLNVSSNELYPTSIRNTAFSFLQAVGRIGIVLSPQVFVLREYWDPMPYVFLLGLSSFTLLLYQIFIPETKNAPLHEVMPENKNTNIPLQLKKVMI